MKSMETLLSENLGAMTESQKTKFYDKRVKGSPIEAQVHLAETVLKESGHNIRRNNGASREAGQNTEADFRAESDAILMEALSQRDPRLKKAVEVTESTRLTASQQQDYDFSVAIGLSEADAMRVALSNFIKG